MSRRNFNLEINSMIKDFSILIDMDYNNEVKPYINKVIEDCKSESDLKKLRKQVIDILEEFVKNSLRNNDFSLLLAIWDEIQSDGKLQRFLNKLKQLRIASELNFYIELVREIPTLSLECEKAYLLLKSSNKQITNQELIMMLQAYCILNNIEMDLELKDANDSNKEIISEETSDYEKEYIKMIKQIPLLTTDEEYRLLKLSHNGDIEARQKLIESNLRLVLSRVQGKDRFGIPLMDLMQEGTLGLIQAIKNYDLERRSRLSTYAIHYIDKFCQEASLKSSPILKGNHYQQRQIKNFNNAQQELSIKNCKEATFDETVKYLNLTKKQKETVNFLLNHKIIPIEQKISEDSDDTIVDLIEDSKSIIPEEIIIKNSILEEIKKELKKLTQRERYAICLRFGLLDGKCYTLRDAGIIMNISHAGVEKLEKKAKKS